MGKAASIKMPVYDISNNQSFRIIPRLQLTVFDTITCNAGQDWPVGLTTFYFCATSSRHLTGMKLLPFLVPDKFFRQTNISGRQTINLTLIFRKVNIMPPAFLTQCLMLAERISLQQPYQTVLTENNANLYFNSLSVNQVIAGN